MKENPHWKCVETGDNCNSVFRTMEEDQAWQDMQRGNWISSQLLWQPLITKTNDHTSGKSLSWISSGEFTRELDKEPLLN